MHRQRTVPLTIASPSIDEALQSLPRLAQLPRNWDSYGADPPNETAIGLARDVLKAMSDADLKPSHVDPSAENGVCISFVQDTRYADIECFNSGEILAVTSSGDGQPTVWQVPRSPLDIKSAVGTIQAFFRR
jgi:hypothetical protein